MQPTSSEGIRTLTSAERTESLLSIPECPDTTGGAYSEKAPQEVEDYDMLHEIEHEKDIYRLRVSSRKFV